MSKRIIDTDMWGDQYDKDRWFRELSPSAKLLFIYLWTNNQCNQAGLYKLNLDTVSYDTRLRKGSLLKLFDELCPKVEYYPESNLVWVKNFVKRQTFSPKFLVAVAKCLEEVKNDELINRFLAHNDNLSIPYPYHINTPNIPQQYPTDTTRPEQNRSDQEQTSTENPARLFEHYMGKLITPFIADELKQLEGEYPLEWIEAAFREAAGREKRSLSYARAILERWGEEGFPGGEVVVEAAREERW